MIIEDDESLVRAISAALVKSGCVVDAFADTDPALQALTNKKYDFLLVDCLLQQMTGVDFVIRAKEYVKVNFPKVILMSGLFQDIEFIQDATGKTNAISFLKKPFSLESLTQLIFDKKSATGHEREGARQILYGIFGKEKVTPRDKRKMIESLEEVSGFDLPFIYSLLSETKSSGFLNIYSKSGVVSGVTFSNGAVVAVDLQDDSTRVGNLLIQSGYALSEHVKAALSDSQNRKMGQYLIQNNLLSPHAFDLVLEEQMNVRLSRTITEAQIKINFSSAEVESQPTQIGSDKLLLCLHDWIASKIPSTWLKSLYGFWSTNRIMVSSGFDHKSPVMKLHLMTQNEGLLQDLQSGTSISSLLMKGTYKEELLLKALHLLLTKGMISFNRSIYFASSAEQVKHLERVLAEINSMSDVRTLEYIGFDSRSNESAAAAVEKFMPSLGAKPANPKSEMMPLWYAISKRLEKAVTNVGLNHEKMQQEATQSDAERRMQGTNLLEQAKQLLAGGQYKTGLEKVQQAMKLDSMLFQIRLYLAWGKITQLEERTKSFQMKDIEMDLTQVPPEERYDYLYPFVSGLIQKANSDFIGAKRSFEKSLALDSNFLPARRELSSVVSLAVSKKDTLNMDLKDVVSGFFKKK